MNLPKVFVVDVDGVMTNGQFYYTAEGKVMKAFGPDDHDGLSLLSPWEISSARVPFPAARRTAL